MGDLNYRLTISDDKVHHFLSLPHLTLPCLALPLTLPYLTLPYLTLPYLTLPYLTLPYLTLPCFALHCLASTVAWCLYSKAVPFVPMPGLCLWLLPPVCA